MSRYLVNVTMAFTRRGDTRLTDRQTLAAGERQRVATLDGVLEETTDEEKAGFAGLDAAPSMRFIAYRSWLLKAQDRGRVLRVLHKWRDRYSYLSGRQYLVLSTVNSNRGTVAFLGPAEAEA